MKVKKVEGRRIIGKGSLIEFFMYKQAAKVSIEIVSIYLYYNNIVKNRIETIL